MTRSNWLIIMSDQHARHAAGFSGNPIVTTPNLDRLAKAGTSFSSAYCASPICVSSRASFVTGRPIHETGNWDNAAPYVGTEAASWGHRLQAAGYRVTTIGKLHFRQASDPTGFDDQRLPMHVLDGVGDLHGLLRERMPKARALRRQLLDVHAGESTYTEYDRSIAQAAVRWLQNEAATSSPWALWVSFVTPHPPLIAPRMHFDQYRDARIPQPVGSRPSQWPSHPVLEGLRRLAGFDEELSESESARAIAAYYGLVSFMDEQVGCVLRALDDAGLAAETRILYVSDHGEMLGQHGLWMKTSMYEASVAIPMLLVGSGIPASRVCNTNVSLLDCFPTILHGAGVALEDEDASLTGRSLLAIANDKEHERISFSEYHGILSVAGTFMIRNGRFKYVYYVGHRPQLFDLDQDPDELVDLAGDEHFETELKSCHRQLEAICDPDAIDRLARADQRRRIEAAGGVETLAAAGLRIPYTPAPSPSDTD